MLKKSLFFLLLSCAHLWAEPEYDIIALAPSNEKLALGSNTQIHLNENGYVWGKFDDVNGASSITPFVYHKNFGFKISPLHINNVNSKGMAVGWINKKIVIGDVNLGKYYDLFQYFKNHTDKEFTFGIIHQIYITDENRVILQDHNPSTGVWRILDYDLINNNFTVITHPNDDMFLHSVNPIGQMMGQYYRDGGWFFDSHTGCHPLSLPENFNYSHIGNLLSSNGFLVGYAAETLQEGNVKGFLWHLSTGMKLIEGTTHATKFSGINNQGQVIGNNFLYHPKSGMASMEFSPKSINNLSQVVGSKLSQGKEKAIIWEEVKKERDLNSLIPKNSGWNNLADALKINDHGYIVGRGSYLAADHLFLLIPRKH